MTSNNWPLVLKVYRHGRKELLEVHSPCGSGGLIIAFHHRAEEQTANWLGPASVPECGS